jgi:hypothetical protein
MSFINPFQMVDTVKRAIGDVNTSFDVNSDLDYKYKMGSVFYRTRLQLPSADSVVFFIGERYSELGRMNTLEFKGRKIGK